MEQLVSYIRPELVLLIPALYFVGMGLKKTALVQDRWIPLFVCGVGVALSALYTFATGELTSLRQGALLLFTKGFWSAAQACCAISFISKLRKNNRKKHRISYPNSLHKNP